MTSSAWWAHPGIPWSHTWGLILSSRSFWSRPIGEGGMGSSVVTRSCRALGAEKLPITRTVPSLVSMSLPNKGVGHLGTTNFQTWEIFVHPINKEVLGESFCNCFSCSTQNGTGLGREGPRLGGQDRVGSPCVNQEVLRPACHIQLHACLQPHDGYL